MTGVLIAWGVGVLLGGIVGWRLGNVPMGLVLTLAFGPLVGLFALWMASKDSEVGFTR